MKLQKMRTCREMTLKIKRRECQARRKTDRNNREEDKRAVGGGCEIRESRGDSIRLRRESPGGSDSPSPALQARMERVLICFPSMVLLEHVWEQLDHDVQSLSTQSLEQGTSQATGAGGGKAEQRVLSTNSPEEETRDVNPAQLNTRTNKTKCPKRAVLLESTAFSEFLHYSVTPKGLFSDLDSNEFQRHAHYFVSFKGFLLLSVI